MSVSDILSNATRGIFAEFIVGTAIGLNPKNTRNEWDAFDLLSDDGIKIEVKSSAYIQSWYQERYSNISFSIKPAKYWNPENNILQKEAKRHADVYVFCLLKHKDQETIDPLKMEQWEFYVVPTHKLNNYINQKSLSLKSLKQISNSIEYKRLNIKIREMFAEQKSLNVMNSF